jgi:hypothetical protein
MGYRTDLTNRNLLFLPGENRIATGLYTGACSKSYGRKLSETGTLILAQKISFRTRLQKPPEGAVWRQHNRHRPMLASAVTGQGLSALALQRSRILHTWRGMRRLPVYSSHQNGIPERIALPGNIPIPVSSHTSP